MKVDKAKILGEDCTVFEIMRNKLVIINKSGVSCFSLLDNNPVFSIEISISIIVFLNDKLLIQNKGKISVYDLEGKELKTIAARNYLHNHTKHEDKILFSASNLENRKEKFFKEFSSTTLDIFERHFPLPGLLRGMNDQVAVFLGAQRWVIVDLKKW